MKFETLANGLRVHAPAKLNLYLEVGPRRADGFHEIDSVFQAVSLCDEIDFETDEDLRLEADGIGAGEDNLCHRAARLLSAEVPAAHGRGARMTLRKRIPQGAGLGGGSSDAAATLLALNRLWELGLDRRQLAAFGARLGSDVPFFFHGGTARCRGRGERVTPFAAPRQPSHYVLVYPGVMISTAEVYEALDRSRGPEFALTVSGLLDSMTPTTILTRLTGGELFFNRLEGIVCQAFTELAELRARLRKSGFLKVLMSGSGSTFFGVCRGADEASRLAAQLTVDLPGAAAVFPVESLPGWSCR